MIFKLQKKPLAKVASLIFSSFLLGSYGIVKMARDLISSIKVALKIYEKFRLYNQKRR